MSAYLLDGQVVDLDGLRIGGVGGIAGNPGKPGRRDAGTFIGLIERVLAESPDILVLHEGPDDPASDSKGHGIWTRPFASLGSYQLNVAERAVLLRMSPEN